MLTSFESHIARVAGAASMFSTSIGRLGFVGVAIVATLGGCAADAMTETSEDEMGSTSSSIVGGTTTSAFPAVGALTRSGSPFCTGTVVAPRVVVTAAHCLAGARASSLRFAIGPNAFSPSAALRITRVTAHPGYDPNQLINDIGVVVLAEDAPVTPIPMNTTAFDASWVGRSLTFVGYGVTSGITQSGGGVKRQVAIPIAQIGSSQFAYTGSKNTCFGDSGGPALTQDAQGATVLAGVTSYGDATCRSFGVDTRVDVFRTFVAQASAP
jgi:secreted trypsin-like serine protease